MRRMLVTFSVAGCAVLGGCSFENNTVLTNTTYEGRYTDGDFKEKRASDAVRRMALSLRNAGFAVSRRSAEQLLADQDFVVTPGEWIVVSEEEVENPDTGEMMTNVVREFVPQGDAVRITLTCDVVLENGRNGALRGVRYRVWPESARINMPIEGTTPEENATPFGVFIDAVRAVVDDFGTPLEEVPGEGATNDG